MVCIAVMAVSGGLFIEGLRQLVRSFLLGRQVSRHAKSSYKQSQERLRMELAGKDLTKLDPKEADRITVDEAATRMLRDELTIRMLKATIYFAFAALVVGWAAFLVE